LGAAALPGIVVVYFAFKGGGFGAGPVAGAALVLSQVVLL
jgi:hypothetical protein